MKDGTDTRETWMSNVSGDLYLAAGGNDNAYHSRIRLMDGKAVYLDVEGIPGAFQVDSSGRILKPSTPAFLAYHQASDLNYAVNATLAFPYTLYNIGNHYNTSNSTFTAPIAGRYFFSINAQGYYDSNVSGIPRAYWRINGSTVANGIHLRGSDNRNTGTDADGLEQRSQTVIFNLAANDTVKMVVGQNRWDLFAANSFTGYLIG